MNCPGVAWAVAAISYPQTLWKLQDHQKEDQEVHPAPAGPECQNYAQLVETQSYRCTHPLLVTVIPRLATRGQVLGTTMPSSAGRACPLVAKLGMTGVFFLFYKYGLPHPLTELQWEKFMLIMTLNVPRLIILYLLVRWWCNLLLFNKLKVEAACPISHQPTATRVPMPASTLSFSESCCLGAWPLNTSSFPSLPRKLTLQTWVYLLRPKGKPVLQSGTFPRRSVPEHPEKKLSQTQDCCWVSGTWPLSYKGKMFLSIVWGTSYLGKNNCQSDLQVRPEVKVRRGESLWDISTRS